MTTRARRRQAAKRAVRWREQAARLIAAVMRDAGQWRDWGVVKPVHVRGFDVAAVRAYCKRLLAEADELDMQREVFADWTRMRGMGPENRDGGAFVSTSTWCVTVNAVDEPGYWSLTVDSYTTERVWIEPIGNVARDIVYVWLTDMLRQHRHVRAGSNWLEVVGKHVHVDAPSPSVTIACIGLNDALSGGWPGKLAHDYVAFKRAKRKCSRRDCDGGVLTGDFAENAAASLAATGRVTITATKSRSGVACPECEHFAEAPTPRTFANGGNMRRAAQRLLDTLDGRCPWNDAAEAQPDECDDCDGYGYSTRYDDPEGYVDVPGPGWDTGERVTCDTCGGTGHNLRGTLPPLPEATRRKLQHDGRRLATRIAEHIQATLAANLGMPERLLFPERNTRTPVEMPAEFASGGMLHYFDITDPPTATDPVRRIAFAGRVEAVDLSSVTLPEDPT